jgi:hypothetical protein
VLTNICRGKASAFWATTLHLHEPATALRRR